MREKESIVDEIVSNLDRLEDVAKREERDELRLWLEDKIQDFENMAGSIRNKLEGSWQLRPVLEKASLKGEAKAFDEIAGELRDVLSHWKQGR